MSTKNYGPSHYGPLMIDVAGLVLTDAERERLRHPLVGGAILFTRNYADPAQLSQLCAAIKSLREPPLLIAIDHEGGRVQRCHAGFTRVPPMRRLGEWWDRDPQAALTGTRAIGFTLAAELRACGVDLSFTPVLDLDYGASGIIGDRAFHREPGAVIALAGALIEGLREAGMACCGKHYPGHGFIRADSHLALPVDERTPAEMAEDLQPYRELKLDAVMAAHVLFPAVDAQRPAGFSPVWIDKLRQELNFDGAIFTDDLSMEGAAIAGDMLGRVAAAWAAGCDMLPVCNVPEQVTQVLDHWSPQLDPLRSARIARLIPAVPALTLTELDRQCAAGRDACHQCLG
jgi:beta-N-acetylhexosaminidase